MMQIDTAFDFRTDSGGRDPDQHSPTLRRYHQFLWSKQLPGGRHFGLTTQGSYLHHYSDAGEFLLASDSVMQTFTRWRKAQTIVGSFPAEDIKWFNTITYTIGGMLIFPASKIGGKMTINGARGLNHKIADRIDLTLECIRRHYLGLKSPLADTFERYQDFFDLFGDFSGYVDFFLLQDLIVADESAVKFFVPFSDFSLPPVPRDVESYARFMEASIQFVEARNRRIASWVERRATSLR